MHKTMRKAYYRDRDWDWDRDRDRDLDRLGW